MIIMIKKFLISLTFLLPAADRSIDPIDCSDPRNERRTAAGDQSDGMKDKLLLLLNQIDQSIDLLLLINRMK